MSLSTRFQSNDYKPRAVARIDKDILKKSTKAWKIVYAMYLEEVDISNMF